MAGLSFLVLGSWGSEFSRFGRWGGLSFLGLGFPNLVHAWGRVWERGGSEFPGSEVRSGTPLYEPYTRYVPPQRAGFLHHFGLKTGLVLEGIMRVYECIYHLNSK